MLYAFVMWGHVPVKCEQLSTLSLAVTDFVAEVVFKVERQITSMTQNTTNTGYVTHSYFWLLHIFES